MKERIQRAAAVMRQRGKVAVLTGAGISVESGIPDFRSAGGLWSRYDPAEYATLSAFRRDPDKVWRMLAEMIALLEAASPNRAHRALAQLEASGIVSGIVTQNIDGLHQAAGSRRVLEFHGNCRSFRCLQCGTGYDRDRARDLGAPPTCNCGFPLKPDIVFFGELISDRVLADSRRLAAACAVMLVVGTSAEVVPANEIPWVAKNAGAAVLEINVEPTVLTRSVTDIFLQGRATAVLQQLGAAVVRAGG